MSERKPILVRLDPRVHAALERLARDELRSLNAEIEFLIREALLRLGRLPKGVRPPPAGEPPPGNG